MEKAGAAILQQKGLLYDFIIAHKSVINKV
jgi:hypothetical protein